jgi:hypothetical protein
MTKILAAILVAVSVSACGFTVTSTPQNANTCAIGAVYGCDNSNKARPPAPDAPDTLEALNNPIP